MAKRKIAVMDLGSSEIRTVVLQIKGKKNYEIIGKGIESYAGFLNGKFLESEKLENAIKNSCLKAKKTSKFNFKELYVGIGGEFLIIRAEEVETAFLSIKKITQYDIDTLAEKADKWANNKKYTLISYNPVDFVLDEEKEVAQAVGLKCKTLKAVLSFEYAESEFIKQLNDIFKNVGLSSVNYISAPQAQLKTLLKQEAKKEIAAIVDCGYMSTYVLLGKNNGMLSLSSFNVGGGHLMGDLAKLIKIDFEQAEDLKKKAILTLDEEADGGYEVEIKGQAFEVPAGIVGDVIKARLNMICQLIQKAIDRANVNYPLYFPLFLTGGGISLIKGAKQYLQKELGRPVEILSSSAVALSKPYDSALAALCAYSVQKEIEMSYCFLAKLFGK
ncbi:MAG: cell division FtsA domain-containing protein [Christensenellales bacterium]|jgi:cell division protein FtsA